MLATGEQVMRRSESQMIVHGADGAYLMEKSRWPTLKLASDDMESDPVESMTQEPSLVSPLAT